MWLCNLRFPIWMDSLRGWFESMKAGWKVCCRSLPASIPQNDKGEDGKKDKYINPPSGQFEKTCLFLGLAEIQDPLAQMYYLKRTEFPLDPVTSRLYLHVRVLERRSRWMERKPRGWFHWRAGEIQLQSFAFTWQDKETETDTDSQNMHTTLWAQPAGTHSVISPQQPLSLHTWDKPLHECN